MADPGPAGGDRGDAVDARPTGRDLELDAELLVDAGALGHDLAHDAVAGEPTELHVDLRRIGTEGLDADEGTTRP